MNRKLWIAVGCVLGAALVLLGAGLLYARDMHRITVISGERFVHQCPKFARTGETVTVSTSVISDGELYVNGVEGAFARPGEYRFVMPDHGVELKVTVIAFPDGA